MNLSWKFLPLAAVFALALLALTPGGATLPPDASADVSLVDAADNSIASGSSTTITIEADEDDGDITVELLGVSGSSTSEIEITDCAGCDEEDDTHATLLVIDSNDAEFVTASETFSVQLTLTCESEDSVTIRATQDEMDDQDVVTCNPPGPNITISKSATDDDSVDFEFAISGPGSECDDASFFLADGEQEDFICQFSDDTYTVTEEVPDGWVLVAINCTDENVPSGDIVGDLEAASLEITLSDANDTVDCTFVNEISEPGDPASVALVVSTSIPPCGLPVVVVATVKDADDNLLQDILVTFTAPSGTFSIPSGVTSSGVLSTLYAPPNTGSDLITITATAGGVIGTVQIQVNCAAAATATAVATATVAVPPATIQPPSTGDAGLESGSGWLPYAGIAGLVAAMFGAAFVTARRLS